MCSENNNLTNEQTIKWCVFVCQMILVSQQTKDLEICVRKIEQAFGT